MTKKILKNSYRFFKFLTRNLIRSLFLVCLGILIFICIGWFLLVIYFNAHNLGQIIVNSLQDNFARPVVINEIKLASLNSVEIKGLKIINEHMEDYDEFISVDDLIIHYDLYPLLKNRVQINEVILNSPVIHIIKNEQGVYNIQNLAVSSSDSQQGQKYRFLLSSLL